MSAVLGAAERRDPFGPFSFDTLVSGAARLRPDTVAFADRDEVLTYAALAARVAALAQLFGQLGLAAGDRMMLVGGAQMSLVVAMAAATRVGIEPALAPLSLGAADLAAYAAAVRAAAIVGTSQYGALLPADAYFAAAATVPSIRVVATLGPIEVDGAVDLRAAAMADVPERRAERDPATTPPGLFTLMRDVDGMRPLRHRQSTLMAAGLDVVGRAKIARKTPILSTLPPVGFSGLVCGPIAALLSGAPLRLDGPFETKRFLDARDAAGAAHLVMPAALADAIADADIMPGLASLILLSRAETFEAAVLGAPVSEACPSFDLYAIGEQAAIVEPRRAGRAQRPADQPHHITFDSARILAVEARRTASGARALSGAAVTPIE